MSHCKHFFFSTAHFISHFPFFNDSCSTHFPYWWGTYWWKYNGLILYYPRRTTKAARNKNRISPIPSIISDARKQIPRGVAWGRAMLLHLLPPDWVVSRFLIEVSISRWLEPAPVLLSFFVIEELNAGIARKSSLVHDISHFIERIALALNSGKQYTFLLIAFWT